MAEYVAQPDLPAQGDALQCVFRDVVVDFRPAVIAVKVQRLPLLKQVRERGWRDSIVICCCTQSYSDCISGAFLAFRIASLSSAGLPRIAASMVYSSPMCRSASVVMSVGVRYGRRGFYAGRAPCMPLQ
ncbi:hypothetical protein BEE12_22080 (plasmid) [Pantoea agglomerans]|nr:hypothetical protein BEE12_22080 [Pantoea agglomerans]